jgi:hypothetical protein
MKSIPSSFISRIAATTAEAARYQEDEDLLKRKDSIGSSTTALSNESVLPIQMFALESRCNPKQISHCHNIVKQIFFNRSKNDPTNTIHNVKKAIGQPTLLRHFPLPGIIGDRFFDVIRTRISSIVDMSGLPTDAKSNTKSSKSKSNEIRSNVLSINYENLLATVAVLGWGSIEERRRFLFELFDCSGSGRVSKFELEGVLTSGALHPNVGGEDSDDSDDSDSDCSNEIEANNGNGGSRFQQREGSNKQFIQMASLMAEDAFKMFGLNGTFSISEFSNWLDATPEVESSLFYLLTPDCVQSMSTNT